MRSFETSEIQRRLADSGLIVSTDDASFLAKFYDAQDLGDEQRSEKVWRRIQSFVSFKVECAWPICTSRADALTLKDALLSHVHWVMPHRRDGSVVVVFNLRHIDPATPLEVYHRMAAYLIERLVSALHADPVTRITLLIDATSCSPVAIARRASVSDIRRGIGIWSRACPFSCAEVLIAASGWATMRMLRAAVWSFASAKIADRVQYMNMCNDGFECLRQRVPAGNIPSNLGGDVDMYTEWPISVGQQYSP